jgi:hypothetical protein
VRIETFKPLINFGAGRQFTASKAHQGKARNRGAKLKDRKSEFDENKN